MPSPSRLSQYTDAPASSQNRKFLTKYEGLKIGASRVLKTLSRKDGNSVQFGPRIASDAGRFALDCWLQELGLQEFGLSIRLVKADDLPPNSCGMSTYDVKGLVGEIDVLRSDEYVNLPGCLDGVDIPKDQLNTDPRGDAHGVDHPT